MPYFSKFSKFQPDRPEPLARIHVILSDFEDNGLFYAVFELLAWPPRTLPEGIILPAFVQF